MAKQKSLNTSNNGRYERFIRGLKLVGLGLKSSSARLERQAYSQLRQGKKEPNRRIQTDYRVVESGDNFFDCEADFHLIFEHPATKDSVLLVECTFEAHFHFDAKTHGQFARRFVSSEFRLVVWPYFRQFVTDVTGRMGIFPVTVPLSSQSQS